MLWDRQRQTIVNNESSEIIRMLDHEFGDVGATGPVFCPEHLVEEIDGVNAFVYRHVNNGVYKAGFATTQSAYEEAVVDLFDALDQLEIRLGNGRYLLGDELTEDGALAVLVALLLLWLPVAWALARRDRSNVRGGVAALRVRFRWSGKRRGHQH